MVITKEEESRLEEEIHSEDSQKLIEIILSSRTYEDYPSYNFSSYEFVLGDEQIEIGMKAVYKKEIEIEKNLFDVKTHTFKDSLNNEEKPDYFLLRANDSEGGLYVVLRDTLKTNEVSQIFLDSITSFKDQKENNFLAYLGSHLRKSNIHFNTVLYYKPSKKLIRKI